MKIMLFPRNKVVIMVLTIILLSYVYPLESWAQEKDLNQIIDEFNRRMMLNNSPKYIISSVFNHENYKETLTSIKLKETTLFKNDQGLYDEQNKKLALKGAKENQSNEVRTSEYSSYIVADLNRDGIINGEDMSYLAHADINGDGVTDYVDYNIVMETFARLMKMDVNSDGFFDLTDVEDLKRRIELFKTDHNRDGEVDSMDWEIVLDEYPEILRGDMNDDGILDVADLIIIDDGLQNRYLGDLDGDGRLSTKDLEDMDRLFEIKRIRGDFIKQKVTTSVTNNPQPVQNKDAIINSYYFSGVDQDVLAADNFIRENNLSPEIADGLYGNIETVLIPDDSISQYLTQRNRIINAVLTGNKRSGMRYNAIKNLSFKGMIDSIKQNKERTELENTVLKASDTIDELREYMDEKTENEFKQVVKLIILAHTMRNMIKGADFKVINGALTELIDQCRNTYNTYLGISEAIYKDLAGILGVDLDDILPDEYKHLATMTPRARRKLLIDLTIRKLEEKDSAMLTAIEKQALSLYREKLEPLRKKYYEKFKTIIEKFTFAVKKALVNASPASKTENKSQFQALFVLGTIKN